jgi:hypothetical protein
MSAGELFTLKTIVRCISLSYMELSKEEKDAIEPSIKQFERIIEEEERRK